MLWYIDWRSEKISKNLPKITEKDKYFITELTDIDKEVESIIKDEFCNYVLSQVKG